jgi:hypothetical protein
MGYLKLSNGASNKVLVNCDNMVEVVAAISGTGASAVATVDITYAIVAGGGGTTDEAVLLKTAVTYAAPGASNEYSFTEAELESAWLDALVKMSGASGSIVEGPKFFHKVTATGVDLGAVVPTIVIKHGAQLA